MIRLSLFLVALGLLTPLTVHAVPATQHPSSCRWPSMHTKFARIHWSSHAHPVRHAGSANASHHASGL